MTLVARIELYDSVDNDTDTGAAVAAADDDEEEACNVGEKTETDALMLASQTQIDA